MNQLGQPAPRIAIPTPTTGDAAYNDRSWSGYASAVEQSGGIPVRFELALTSSAFRELAGSVQGICLPGSPADVDPARYGAVVDPATAPADPAREQMDYALLEHAQVHGLPVLAICFGLQSLNVWRGGTLVQDLTPVPVNHAAGGKVAVAHTALIAEASTLGRLIGATPESVAEAPLVDGFLRLPVNTSHHQAVSIAGEGLRVVARSPEDGVVEAVEAHHDESAAAQPMMLGVQWHPERSFDISATSRALFAQLVTEARLVIGAGK